MKVNLKALIEQKNEKLAQMEALLSAVLDEKLANERTALLAAARQMSAGDASQEM